MFRVDFFVELIFSLIKYIPVTLKLAFLSLILSITLAVVLAVIRHYEVKGLNALTKVYVSFFRSTPFISQLFLFYFGLARYVPFIRDMSSTFALVLILGLNTSSFMCETIRGALLSVDKGQVEAGQSLGMSNIQIMRYIILPQAVKVAIPPLSNNFINLTKNTAMGFTVGIIDLMGKAKLEAANSFRFTESYLAVLIVYWVMIAAMTKVQSIIEEKMKNKY